MTTAKKRVPKKNVEDTTETVAIYTPNPQFHPSLGRLEKGYNIVTKDVAEQWISLSNKIREASPQEVAASFGV